MVEMQVRQHTVVSADDAASAVLIDEDPLDLPVPPRDGFADAPLAPVPVLARVALVEVVYLHAVARALADNRGRARLRGPALTGVWVSVRHEHMFASMPDGPTCPAMRPRRLELRSSDLKGRRSDQLS